MMKMFETFLGALIVVSVSCTSLVSKLAETPRIENQSVSVTGINLQQVDFSLEMEIRNPNSIDLPVQELQADLQVFNKPFLSKSWEGLPTLVANQTTTVKLPFSMEWKSLIEAGVSLWGGKRQVPYSVTGSAKVKGFNIPFQQSGQLDVNNLAH